jgi:hypothetical protein
LHQVVGGGVRESVGGGSVHQRRARWVPQVRCPPCHPWRCAALGVPAGGFVVGPEGGVDAYTFVGQQRDEGGRAGGSGRRRRRAPVAPDPSRLNGQTVTVSSRREVVPHSCHNGRSNSVAGRP